MIGIPECYHLGVIIAAGIVAGIAIGFAIATLASGLLFGISAHDPLTYGAAAALLAAAALAASYFPARRAIRRAQIWSLQRE